MRDAPDGDGWLLVHDLEEDRDPGVWLALGLALVIGLVAAVLGWRALSERGEWAPAAMAGVIAIGLLVTGVLVPLRERRVLLAAMRQGRVQRVSGCIADHRVWRERRSNGPVKALSDSSTAWTTIRVADTEFEFLSWPWQRAMERRGLAPVELREGLSARIVYLPGSGPDDDPRARRIVRFECRPESPRG